MDTKLSRYLVTKLAKEDIPLLIGLVSLGLFLSLFYAWNIPLIDPDEPRYAATARDMILNGNWVVPYFNGAPRINKPPLFYWTIVICYKIFGIHELSARLPSALAATGTVIITYVWGKRLGDRKDGFWAGIVLMSSPLFFFISHFCITDMLLNFFICASLYLFFIEYNEINKSNGRRLLLYCFLAMVFLVKGPVGILLFILITICFLIWIRDFQYIKRLWYLPGFLLFISIICAWGVPFWISLGTKQIFTLFSNETPGRFMSGYAHPQPLYYYMPITIIGFFPWSLFVFVPLIHLLRKRKSIPSEEKKPAYFFCSWFICTLAFFSASHSKLITYILPISPSVALLTLLFFRWEKESKLWKEYRWMLRLVLGLSMLFLVGAIFTMPKWLPVKYGFSLYHIIILAVILFPGMLISFLTISFGGHLFQLRKIFCFTNSIFLLIVIVFLSKYIGIFRSTKDIVEKSSLDKMADYTLLSYPRLIPSLVFYSGKVVKEIEFDVQFKSLIADQTKPVYIMMSLNDYQKKKNWIKKENFHKVYQNSAHIILKKEIIEMRNQMLPKAGVD